MTSMVYELSEFHTINSSELAQRTSATFANTVRPTMLELAKAVNGSSSTMMAFPTLYQPRSDAVPRHHQPYSEQFKRNAAASATSGATSFRASASTAAGATTTAAPPQQEQSPITKIRLLLNKLTDKNYDDYSTRITRALNLYSLTEETAKEILTIASSNTFYVTIYAKLYTQLAAQFPMFISTLKTTLAAFFDKIDQATYTADQSDYSAFCKMNEDMDKRRAQSVFFAHLAKNGTVPYTVIIRLISSIITKVTGGLETVEAKVFMDELSEHVASLLDKDAILYVRNSGDTALFDTILALSKKSIKTSPGLTSKAIFKYGDVATLIKNTV